MTWFLSFCPAQGVVYYFESPNLVSPILLDFTACWSFWISFLVTWGALCSLSLQRFKSHSSIENGVWNSIQLVFIVFLISRRDRKSFWVRKVVSQRLSNLILVSQQNAEWGFKTKFKSLCSVTYTYHGVSSGLGIQSQKIVVVWSKEAWSHWIFVIEVGTS